MLEVEYSNQARRFLRKADKSLANRLLKKIEDIRIEPVGHDTKTLDGFKEKLFRARVGDYRILYEVDNENNKLGIVKIEKRARAYSN